MQSIVTSYGSYLVENVIDILGGVLPNNKENKLLWTLVLRTLNRAFQHDQDREFYVDNDVCIV